MSLRRIAENDPITKTVASAHGTKYIIESRIGSLRGKAPLVRTVWIIDKGLDLPRLVTAYPRDE